MKIVNKLTLGALLIVAAVAVVLRDSRPAPAQDAARAAMKNLAVVSISGYDELKSDLGFLGTLAGNPDAAATVEGLITMFTQGQGLAGLDTTKPLGAIVQADGEQIQPLVFVPVTDLSKLLDVLAAMNVNAEKGDNGIFEVEVPNQPLFIKEQGGWAFVGQSADALANLPANPMQLIGDLAKEYDVAIRLNVQNVPEEYRQKAVEQLKLGVSDGFDRVADEGNEAFELRKKLVEAQVNGLVEVIEQTDSLIVGWTIDSQAEKTFFEFSLTATPGSKLAQQAAQAADTKSLFHAFVRPDGAVTFNASGKWTEDDIVQALAMLAAARTEALQSIDEDSDLPDDAAREIVKSAVGDLLDVAAATVEAGSFDAGAVLRLDPETLTFAAGLLVADGKGVEDALKKLASLAENEPEFPGIKWDADEHNGVRFHVANVPVPEDENDARQLLGDELEVVIGIGEKSVYLAFGKEGLSTLKDAIDQSKAESNKQVAPVDFSVSLGKVVKFASSRVDDPNVALLSEVLENADGNDHITVVSRAIPNGVSCRIEIESDVLQAIGKVRAAVGGAVPGDF